MGKYNKKGGMFFIIMRAVCLSMELVIATGIISHTCCFIVFWGTSHLQIFLPMSDPFFICMNVNLCHFLQMNSKSSVLGYLLCYQTYCWGTCTSIC